MARLSKALAALVLTACSGSGGSSQPDAPIDFDRRGMLANIADHHLIPTYDRVATEASALASAVDTHCMALAGTGDPGATQAAARAAWATAIDTWEIADAILVGPAVANAEAIRNRIYAWPFVATCTIDQDVVARAGGSYDVTTRPDNARSLAAIEYLLFYTMPASTCALTPNGWDALGANLPRARCDLAAAIADDVAAQAAALATTWAPAGGNYRDQLVLAPDERGAVNMVSDGLFYADDIVKDMKIGEAAGMTVNACGTVDMPCVREVEHRWADRSSFAIRANLRSLRAAFTGTTATGDGLGFDDYLRAAGAAALADRMTTSIDGAIAAADALPDAYIAALSSDRPKVFAAHAAIKLVTDDLKSQFLTVLGLDIPDDVAGDND